MAKEKIRIRIKGYDHALVDQAAEKIVETAKRTMPKGIRTRQLPDILSPGLKSDILRGNFPT